MEIVPESSEKVVSGSNLLKIVQAVQEKGASVRFKAKGYSMTPTIRHNDIITISPLPDRDLKQGDLLLFQRDQNSQITVHRIIKVKGKVYLMRGDNSAETDGWITEKMVFGIVTGIERHGKKKSPGLGGLLFFSPYIMNVRRNLVQLISRFRKKGN